MLEVIGINIFTVIGRAGFSQVELAEIGVAKLEVFEIKVAIIKVAGIEIAERLLSSPERGSISTVS